MSRIREFENRYWEENNGIYELHFTQFYEDEIYFKLSKEEDGVDAYFYDSEPLKIEYGYLSADSIEEAMKMCEDMVVEHIEDEICYYTEMLRIFNDGCEWQ